MSLLLDALKKAAKDKEASSAAAESAPAPVSDTDNTSPSVQSEPPELTLDDITDPQANSAQPAKDAEPPPPPEQPLTFDAEPSPNRVSDEALQVLIYKTNHAHRKRRRIIWGGAAAISVITLTISGLYFFKQIQQEINTLETKHRVNMRAVESEPVKAKNLKLAANADVVAGDKKSGSASPVKPVAKSVTSKAPTQNKASTKNSRRTVSRAST